MKIAIDCRMSGMSGIGVYLDNILAYLLTVKTEHTYVLIGDQLKLACYEKMPHVKIVQSEAPIFSIKEVIGFPIKEINQCNVFYSPNFNIPLGIKIPVFGTIHDMVFLDVMGLTSKFGKIVRWFVLWRTVHISSKLFTVSEFSKNRILYHFKKAPEIIVANSGINRELKAFQVSQTVSYDFQYILFIGNIKKHKGLDVLLDAFDRARQKGFAKRLVIVGDYEHFKSADVSIIKRIDEQNENVVFTGRISNEQLYNTIAHAALLVQPSVYEGFGLPPLEALYLGCNVLISDIQVFYEIYAKLPVSFFKLNNVDDLSEKIILHAKDPISSPSIKGEIDNLYSLDRTAQIILNQLLKQYDL